VARRKTEEENEGSFRKATPISKVKEKIVPVEGLLGKLTVLAYGKSGTGKTTFASSALDLKPVMPKAKKVLFLDISEEGTDSIYNLPDTFVIPIETWDDFEGVHNYLKKEHHGYKAVVIDTVTQLQRLAMEEAKRRANLDVEAAMSQRAWGFLSSMTQPKLIDYRDLPMHVIFTAQPRRTENDDDDEDELNQDVGPAVIPSIATTLNAMVKVIGQTYITQKEKRVKGKIKISTTYRLRLGPHQNYITKVRCPKSFFVPSSIPDPNLKTIVDIIRGNYGKAKQQKS